MKRIITVALLGAALAAIPAMAETVEGTGIVKGKEGHVRYKKGNGTVSGKGIAIGKGSFKGHGKGIGKGVIGGKGKAKGRGKIVHK